MIRALQPLRIPGGWNVSYNTWCEVDVDAEGLDAFEFFQQDLLQVKNKRFNILLDVGWYGDYPVGAFRAVVHRGDFQGPELASFTSPKRLEVVSMVEQWLDAPETLTDPK